MTKETKKESDKNKRSRIKHTESKGTKRGEGEVRGICKGKHNE